MQLRNSLYFVFLFSLYGFPIVANSQHELIDSLKQVLTTLSKEDEQYVHTLWLAMNETIQADNPRSAAYAREAYALSKNFPNLRNKATVSFAERLVFVEQLDSADYLLDIFYQSFVASPGDSALLTKYYLTKGSIASRRSKLEDAGEFYTKAINLANIKGDDRTSGIAYLRIGSMYHRESDFKAALEYFLNALDYFRKIKSESGMSSAYSNISSTYAYLGNNESADLYLDSTLLIEERLDQVDALIVSYGNVVINSVQRRKDLARAQKFLEKLNKVSVRSTTPRLKGYTSNVMAIYYRGKGEYQLAYNAALDAYKIGKEGKIKFVLLNAYENLVTTAETMKNFEKAYFFQKERNAFKDSINQVEQETVLLELKTKYDSEKKDSENQRLLQSNQQQVFLNKVLGGGGVVLIIMVGSLFYFFVGKQKANKQLEKQKRQIEINLREKESLLREIHHRVKNNLQVISSLLNMQSYHLDDPGMINAIAEGQSRVKAMALIHQKLYQTEQLTEIDFEEYTNQLINHLATAFGQPDKKINSKVSGANIKLDIDTAIPLGLILNELVTNAYKYAFEGVNEGDLAIELQRVDDHQYELTVADSGKGLPGDFDVTKLNSLGLKLVNMLIEQLDGQLTIQSENGTQFSIRFKETRMSA